MRANFERDPQFPPRTVALRARNVRTPAGTVPHDGNSNSTFTEFTAVGPSGAQTKCSLSTPYVRNTHARQQDARKFFRRKSHWNADHRAEDSGLAQPVPEGRAVAHALNLRLAKRDRVFPDFQTPFRRTNLGGGKEGQIAIQIAPQKIVDVMLAGIDSRHKGGPGNRRYRRTGSPEFLECALCPKPSQIRQSPLLDKPVGQVGVHSIETQNHGPLDPRLTKSLAAPQGSNQIMEGPRKESVQRVQESDEKGPKR